MKGDGLEDLNPTRQPDKAGPSPRLIIASLGLVAAAGLGAVGLVRFLPAGAHQIAAPGSRCRGACGTSLTIFWNGDRSRNSSAARLVVNAMPTSKNHFSGNRAISRALAEVIPGHEPDDATFEDPSTKRRYRTAHRGGRLIHEVSLLSSQTEVKLLQTQFPVRYRFGSGHFGRGYLAQCERGFLSNLRSVGSNLDRRGGCRPVSKARINCPLEGQYPNFVFSVIPGTSKEAQSATCIKSSSRRLAVNAATVLVKLHLDQQAASHANNAVADGHGIVNPRRLTRKLAEAVCNQCHLQGDVRVPARGVRAEDFRPGEASRKISSGIRRAEAPCRNAGRGTRRPISTEACLLPRK